MGTEIYTFSLDLLDFLCEILLKGYISKDFSMQVEDHNITLENLLEQFGKGDTLLALEMHKNKLGKVITSDEENFDFDNGDSIGFR